MTMIVFCDTDNEILDLKYCQKLKKSFRELTGWEVKKGTRIDEELEKFSLRYSKEQRDTKEVAVIFAIANNIL